MAVNINRYIFCDFLKYIGCSKRIIGLFVIVFITLQLYHKSLHSNRTEQLNSLYYFQNVMNESVPIRLLNRSSQQNVSSDQNFSYRDIFRRQRINAINCLNIIKGEKTGLRKNRTLYNSSNNMKSVPGVSKPCTEFIKERNYITSSLTKEEEMFPIAYSMLVYRDAPQVERLLRAIYRPQNIYCIHADKKSDPSFKQVIANIASCFDNVFISSRSVNVYWGTFTNLEPELICMEDLLKYKKWKYFINLTGQEFPLRTNYEIVKILKILNGANDIGGSTRTQMFTRRWRNAGKPPHNIRPVKGAVHVAASRKFVEYVQYNQTAKDFLEWTKRSKHPDEVYFNSLNHNPQLLIPGSNKGNLDKKERKINRFNIWKSNSYLTPCYGKYVRTTCIFGVDDLPLLSVRPEIIANKFHLDHQPLALDCLEELIYNRTRDEYLQKLNFNTSFYENLDFLKNFVR